MSDTLSAVSLLVRSLSDEIEARFEKSFAQRDAELVRLRSEVILLKDEVVLTLAHAKKCLNKSMANEDYVTRKLKQFLDSKEFEEAVGQYFTDNWTGLQGVEDPDLTEKIRTVLCDILQRTAFVVPRS